MLVIEYTTSQVFWEGDFNTDLCARSLLGSGLRISTSKGGGKRIGQRGESNCNAFAAEASANPSVSGAGVTLQRTESTWLGTWASVTYFSGSFFLKLTLQPVILSCSFN